MTSASSNSGSAATAELVALLRAVAEDARLILCLLRKPLSHSGAIWCGGFFRFIGLGSDWSKSEYRFWLWPCAARSDTRECNLGFITARDSRLLFRVGIWPDRDHSSAALLALVDADGLLQTSDCTKFGLLGGSGTTMLCTKCSCNNNVRVQVRGCGTSVSIAVVFSVGLVGY